MCKILKIMRQKAIKVFDLTDKLIAWSAEYFTHTRHFAMVRN